MNMREYEFAVQIDDVSFHYLTPVKRQIFEGIPLPLRRVVKTKHVVFDAFQWNVRRGKITALLGQNGSGKTSLIKLISGMRLPNEGSIRVFGLPPQMVKPRIGLCLGVGLIYHRLTARENLEYFGQLYGVSNITKRIEQLAEMLDLGSVLDNLVETYSFGMKAKLAIARSLVHSPDLLILDEPTVGIDLTFAIQIRKFIKDLKCSVLLTTHYMNEAEELADDVCIINRGKILASGTKTEVLERTKVSNIPDAFTSLVDSHNQMRIAS